MCEPGPSVACEAPGESCHWLNRCVKRHSQSINILTVQSRAHPFSAPSRLCVRQAPHGEKKKKKVAPILTSNCPDATLAPNLMIGSASPGRVRLKLLFLLCFY